MADQTITPVKCTDATFTSIAAGNYASLSSSNDGVLVAPPKDGKYLLHFKVTGSGGGTVTIKAGDGFRSSIGDLTSTTISQNGEALLTIESSRFKNLTGSDKGKIRIQVSNNTSVACIQL